MANSPQFVRMTLRLPTEVHTRLKALSERTGESMQAIARQAVKEYIAKAELPVN
jgi:predicted DNA-binding protein